MEKNAAYPIPRKSPSLNLQVGIISTEETVMQTFQDISNPMCHEDDELTQKQTQHRDLALEESLGSTVSSTLSLE